jgi:hypothetical protein
MYIERLFTGKVAVFSPGEYLEFFFHVGWVVRLTLGLFIICVLNCIFGSSNVLVIGRFLWLSSTEVQVA